MACTCGAGACGPQVVYCSPPSPEGSLRLGDMDLQPIEDQMVMRLNWTEKHAKAIRQEYLAYLGQFIEMAEVDKPVDIVPPSNDVDLFWHQHILNTAKYQDDCMKVFGFILHHDPTFDVKDSAEVVAKIKEQLRRRRPPPKESESVEPPIWPLFAMLAFVVGIVAGILLAASWK